MKVVGYVEMGVLGTNESLWHANQDTYIHF